MMAEHAEGKSMGQGDVMKQRAVQDDDFNVEQRREKLVTVSLSRGQDKSVVVKRGPNPRE